MKHARPEFRRLLGRMKQMIPEQTIAVPFPPDLDHEGELKFRLAVASRVNIFRRSFPAGWEFSVTKQPKSELMPRHIQIKRLSIAEAKMRKRTAALLAAKDPHDRSVDHGRPYPLRVNNNGLHLGTSYFDHLSPPRPGSMTVTRVQHRRALREALMNLKPGGSFYWPLPPGYDSGPLLRQERYWLEARIRDYQEMADPLMLVTIGLREDRLGLHVYRPDPRKNGKK